MPDPIRLTVQENDPPIALTPEQAAIIEAVSPTVTTEQITGGWKITITDVDGPHVITLYNGADGRGIASTVLNADYTLTITYTDGTSYTTPSIRGERGAGITSIAYTSTSGLVDTYTITYTTGSPTTFNVTNGADGVNAYVHIRYASAQPTQDSDMSTTPGPWMGVYSGSSATAPEHYTDYAWYKIKGEAGPVQDVLVNGASILDDGIANIPKSGPTTLGVAKVHPGDYGLSIANDGELMVYPAFVGDSKSGANNRRPLTASTQDAATFYGLAKAAGDTSQSSSSNSVGTYTEDAKSKISDMLDAPETITSSTPSIKAMAGVRYICGECTTLAVQAPASGCIDVMFDSGSTPTVLTVTSAKTGVTAIKWANGWDETCEANTTYEINILNGEFGVVASWT